MKSIYFIKGLNIFKFRIDISNIQVFSDLSKKKKKNIYKDFSDYIINIKRNIKFKNLIHFVSIMLN